MALDMRQKLLIFILTTWLDLERDRASVQLKSQLYIFMNIYIYTYINVYDLTFVLMNHI